MYIILKESGLKELEAYLRPIVYTTLVLTTLTNSSRIYSLSLVESRNTRRTFDDATGLPWGQIKTTRNICRFIIPPPKEYRKERMAIQLVKHKVYCVYCVLGYHVNNTEWESFYM